MSREIVIIGGGIIGCTTAYYLVHHPSFDTSSDKVTILEASTNGVAQGASGKAGGLVARWAYPKEIVDISFDEHVKLADKHNGKEQWGWRYVGCGEWQGRASRPATDGGSGVGKGGRRRSLEKTRGLTSGKVHTKRKTGLPVDLDWVEEDLTDFYAPMAGDKETAQVHPYLFTTSMFELAKAKGAILQQGKAKSIIQEDGKVAEVEYLDTSTGESRRINATNVILAAGAWSSRVLPSLPLSGTRAHSVTIRPREESRPVAPYVLFTEISLSSCRRANPEIYARPDDEVYACGPGDNSPLPDSVDDVEVDLSACEAVFQNVASISDVLAHGIVEKRQACFFPSVDGPGGPIIGSAEQIMRGLVIATGHTCWGICNAPGTARAISELIMEGKIKCAKLDKLQPSMFL